MKPNTAATHMADIGGCRLHWRVSGEPGDLPDVLLDHGGSGNADNWNNLLPLLAAHTRVFAYDRAGWGESTSDGLGAGAPAVADRLSRLVAQLPIRKPYVLAGYSLGGLYARYYAAQHPEQVAGLVLVDTTPTQYVIPQDKVRQAMRLIRLLHWAMRLGLGRLYWYLSGRKMDAEFFRRSVSSIAARDFPARTRDELGAIPGIQQDVERVALRPQHPTLAVLAGTQPKMPAEDFARLRAQHEALAQVSPPPLSRLAVVAGADHGTLLSNPAYAQEVAVHMLDFARSLRR
ncbi:MAG TPA: alpha/beta hydrolase [Nevskiaceae bacterium]|nr:alpha/beta hydrolase [Nevskiaceae bacterium]